MTNASVKPFPPNPAMGIPHIQRVRHELRRRELTVSRVEKLASKMVRVVATGESLQGFTSLGFDDHVKLFIHSQTGEGTPTMRDFTPRRHDAQSQELWIDFFLHEAGPATAWAAQASVGQPLSIGGPKGSSIISPVGIDFHLLIGDETALPAMARRLEELPTDARVLAVIDADAGSRAYPFESRAGTEFVWLTRSSIGGAATETLLATLRSLEFPSSGCYAWAALESGAARSVRRYLVDERHFDKHWIKAAGYWQRDAAGVHEVIRDEE